ncbi:hypothetical protein [Streptomyces xanthophaeus]|uniref:hypothetical protein n=1 Tax=Streptomyces xanthophaeus TaxID=67385 RepID=UPI00233E9CC6|nr:hypothetical protein [Streptomyces xanthophaeus]
MTRKPRTTRTTGHRSATVNGGARPAHEATGPPAGPPVLPRPLVRRIPDARLITLPFTAAVSAFLAA